MKPCLPPDYKKYRVDFILDHIARHRRTFQPGSHTVHVDGAKFNLIRRDKKEYYCRRCYLPTFPQGEEKVDYIMVQPKSLIPNETFICHVSRPDSPPRDFDSNIGI